MNQFNKRKIIVISVLSFVFTTMQIAGYRISIYYNTSVHKLNFFPDIKRLSTGQYIFFALIEFGFWIFLLYLLFGMLEKKCLQQDGFIEKPDLGFPNLNNFLLWAAIAFLLFICWIPCFLAAYPGFYNYDAFSQVPQALYKEVPYSAHHPLLHTLIMGKIMLFGLNHGTDLNDGIALYNLFQMIFCVLIFSYVICYLRISIGKIWLCIVTFVYYALFPLIPMFAISTTKDTIFSTLLLLSVIFVYELCKNPLDFFASKRKMIRLEIVLLFMCLFRKNGIFGFIGLVLFMLFYYKKYRKQIIYLFGLEFILFFIVSRSLLWILDAEEGSPEEMLSIPMQQIARVYKDYGEDAFTEEELDMVYSGISMTALLNYNPFLADNIKNNFDYNVIQKHKVDYLWFWIKKGIEYPNTYLKAFLDNTYQAWYPWTSIYSKPGNAQTAYFETGMWPGGVRDSKLPTLLKFYEKIASEYYYQRIPIIRLFFSIGAMFWIVLLILAFAIYQKNYPLVITMLFVLCYCATLLIGPTPLVRYYLILFYGFPLNMGYLLSKKKGCLNLS